MTDAGAQLTPFLGAAPTLAWTEPGWLRGWAPSQPVPVSLHQVSIDLAAVERAIDAAGSSTTADVLHRLRLSLPGGLRETGGSTDERWRAAEGGYIAALQDLPPDLLELAALRVLQTSSSMPSAARIRRTVQAELGARITARARLELARKVALGGRSTEPAPAVPSAADIEHAAATAARVRAALRGTP